MPVQLSDLVLPETWTLDLLLTSQELLTFLNSDILMRSPILDALARGTDEQPKMPYYNDLDDTEANISNDDPDDLAVPRKIDQGLTRGQAQRRNQAWSTMDLAIALADTDPAGVIRSRIAEYWRRQNQRNLASVIAGVIADNAANDNGDMIVDISGETGADAIISADAVLTAKQQLGELAGAFTTIQMHSIQHTNLQRQNLIAYLRDSDTNSLISFYQSYRVEVSDNMPIDNTDPENPIFFSFLYGPNAIGYGVGEPATPFEVSRVPLAGGGEGMEIVSSRYHWLMHPWGFSFVGTPAKQYPTNAELAAATSWNRVWDRKRIPIACIKSLG
jgi:hypothetical protein